jgi:hypothetical protein
LRANGTDDFEPADRRTSSITASKCHPAMTIPNRHFRRERKLGPEMLKVL